MPTKFQLITELYDQTVQSVTGSYQSWTGFLRAACYNYKCPFDDQILIYAQRPDATAVLEMERWNRQFGRWVNRGAKSIAVFGDDGQNCLKLYFDVSDTHASRFARPLPIWTMHPAFEPEVIETLEATFGNLAEKENLADAVRSACHNAVADNFTDYLQDLRECREDSLLEELDDLNLEVFYRDALEVSVAYMLMTRLGLRADDYFTADEFAHVYEFNTPPTINALGIATSDIAEMGLREISRTVMQAQRDQFFANREKSRYDDHTEQHETDRERSKQYGDHLQDAGWLSGAEPADAADAGGASGQVRGAAEGVPEEAPQSALHQPQDQRQADGASGRDRADRAEDGGADRGADGAGRGRDGGAESDRSPALDGPDEQSPAQRGGTGAQRPDLQLTTEEPTEAGSDELPAFVDHSGDYVLLDRLRADCDYFLGAGGRSEKHLWAGNVHAQINKMRELYDALPEKPEWLTTEAIDRYAAQMAAPYQVAAYHHFENGFDDTYASNNTGSGEINDLGTYYTGENGQFQLTGLRDGWYKVTEQEPPTGYAIKEATQEVYIKSGTGKVLTFENIPLSALVVWKYDSVTGAAVQGAVFQVKYLTGTSGTGGTVIGTYKTSANGSFTVTGLKEGTYIVEELASDSGHVIDSAPQTVYISGKQQDVVQLYFGNSPKGALLVKKIDSVTHKPLSDVEFFVTTADGSVVGDANGKYITDSAGTFTITDITPGTTLVVKETRARDGYLLDDAPQTATVKAGQTVTLEFRNQPQGSLIINKLSSADKKTPLEGVLFQITYSNGSYVDNGALSSKGLYRTDKNGQIILSGITGTVIVTEVETIKGYRIDDASRSQTIEVRANDTQQLWFYNAPTSRILLHKVDKATGKGIYGAVFLLYDSNHNPIGEYVTDQDGYIYADEGLADGRYYLREIKAAPGYVLDPELKTIYIRYGSTTEIEWSNTAECGQIQIIKKSADDNATNGLPAGTLLEGAVFEIYDKAGNVVDTIKSDRNGRAVSKTLPLSRYTVREIKAPANYSINPTVMTAYLEFNGQIVTFEVQNTSVSTGVSIKKTGPVQAVPGQPIRYVFSQIKNSSNVALDSFYWRDQLPAQVTLSKIVTGSYNQPLSYKVVYKTNLSGDYRTLADNLSTSKVYVLDARPAVLGLAANERVTEVMFVFGNVKAGFAQVETPYIYATARSGLANNSGIVNVADVGGLYNGQWIQAVSRWLTTVYTKTTVKLPKTGY